MTYEDVLKSERIDGTQLQSVSDCDGRVCKGEIPGLGSRFG